MRSRRPAPGALAGFLAALALPMAAWCQTPVIAGVVNAASYQATVGYAGTIVSVFGSNLASATASAQSIPLPLELAGTSVTVAGVPAPLFYVSPTQINLQVPSIELVGQSVYVVTTAVGSATYNTATTPPGVWNVGGIFTMNASGCGQGAILNVGADGSLSVNSPQNSASPGDWISIFGTGLVWLDDVPPINAAAPSNPPLKAYQWPELYFDFAGDLDTADLADPPWAGWAPGFVGLEQVNAQIPSSVREGCAVPLIAQYYAPEEGNSNPVTIAIHQGGGQCVDPPPGSYGQITWQKTVTTTAPSTVSESDALTVSLQAAPAMQAPPTCNVWGLPVRLCQVNAPPQVGGYVTLLGPACPVPGYRSLDAGGVAMLGPKLSAASVPPAAYQEGQLSGLSAYQATLPNGAIQAGKYTVSAGGGSDVGAFQAALDIGADIQIQTPLAGISVCQQTVNWTGGDPKSWVTVSIVQAAPSGVDISFASQARTAAGTTTILAIPPGVVGCGATPGYPVVISVEVDPDPSEVTTFSAPGLTLGGQATWRYVHNFPAYLAID